MKVNLRIQKNCYPKTYYQFTLIELQFINTLQVWGINATFCNIFLQILHEKSNKPQTDQRNIHNVVVRFLKVILFILACFLIVPMGLLYGIRWIITGKPFPKIPLQILIEWQCTTTFHK